MQQRAPEIIIWVFSISEREKLSTFLRRVAFKSDLANILRQNYYVFINVVEFRKFVDVRDIQEGGTCERSSLEKSRF